MTGLHDAQVALCVGEMIHILWLKSSHHNKDSGERSSVKRSSCFVM